MSLDDATRRELAERLLPLVREAGERILNIYRRDFDVETKDDDSPLTEADRAAHTCLSEGLAALEPRLPVLSEEGAQTPYAQRREWSAYWLVDPLDGTKEFVKKNGEFTVNVALIENGRATIGVVHAPVLGRTWTGVNGDGAWLEADGERTPIHTRAAGDGPWTAVVSRSHRGERVDALLERLPGFETTSMGSSLKFCLVAQGEADIYPRFGPTSEWDTGAAQCVVEAAGGRVLRTDATPLTYNTKESVLNPDFVAVGDPSVDWARYLEGFPVEER
ncbi:3'(2'),5'-bisphosphate nucleotidase CysQ [Arhodomonas sp. AD133]|uniref:3'(2'),5'-bisphosphate nucleotidase CysQ n=1 Tax=Arhodomonas sp. AD133 TaxID=3415009 RepID=UPI003EBA826D